MKLIYFDEVKDEENHPHYHLGAVCLDEGVVGNIEQRIQALARSAFGTSALSGDTEFHAKDIFHRKKNFKEWADFERRLTLLGGFIDILSLDEVQLIDIQVNCKLLRSGQSAEEIAFMFLCERANDLVRAQQSLGMLIGDRESDHLAARFATSLSAYRASGTDFAFGRKIRNLVDSVHFTQSHLSRLLQLADLYVWLLQFQLRNRNSDALCHRAVIGLLKREHVNLYPKKYKEWPKP
jgi:hypothetical protein